MADVTKQKKIIMPFFDVRLYSENITGSLYTNLCSGRCHSPCVADGCHSPCGCCVYHC